MAKPSFSPIRKALEGHKSEFLISLIGELYSLNNQNRDFLNARFIRDGLALVRYKKIIYEALYPSVESESVSFRDAKKAISDYRKAIGDDAGLAELQVYGAETGNQFTCDYGDIDEPFYDSLCRLFESAVKAVSSLESKTAAPFIARLSAIVDKSNCVGWGYHDTIAEIFKEAFPE